jgi:hypothetical protein
MQWRRAALVVDVPEMIRRKDESTPFSGCYTMYINVRTFSIWHSQKLSTRTLTLFSRVGKFKFCFLVFFMFVRRGENLTTFSFFARRRRRKEEYSFSTAKGLLAFVRLQFGDTRLYTARHEAVYKELDSQQTSLLIFYSDNDISASGECNPLLC